MQSLRKHAHRLSRFERLENRALLAGNVTATLAGGLLTITGDAAANNIQVSQLSNGQWQVKGIGTKINGTNSAPTFASVTDISTDLEAGNDTIAVTGGTLTGDLTIQDSIGSSVVQVKNVAAADIFVTTADSNDSITVTNCTTVADLSVSAGNGVNTVVVTNCHAGGTLAVAGGSQTDVIHISGSTADTLSAETFDQIGVVSVTNCHVTNSLSVDVENSTDLHATATISVTNSTMGGELAVSFSDGVAVVTVNNITATDGIDIRPAGGPTGHEVVSLSNASTASDLTIGTLPKSTVAVSHVSAEIAQILCSSGSVISINALTTMFSNNIIGGAVAISVANSHFNVDGTSTTSLELDNGGNSPSSITLTNTTLVGTVQIDTTNQADVVTINKVTADGIRAELGDGRDTLVVENSTATNANFDGGGNPGDTLIKSKNHFGTETDTGFQHVIG